MATPEETRDAILVALQGADGPMPSGELAKATGLKNRDLVAALPQLVADGVVVSFPEGYVVARGETIAAAAAVETSDFPEDPAPVDHGAAHETAGFVPPSVTPPANGAAEVTVRDVLAALARDGGGIRVRAEVVLEAQADGAMRVVQLLAVRGLG